MDKHLKWVIVAVAMAAVLDYAWQIPKVERFLVTHEKVLFHADTELPAVCHLMTGTASRKASEDKGSIVLLQVDGSQRLAGKILDHLVAIPKAKARKNEYEREVILLPGELVSLALEIPGENIDKGHHVRMNAVVSDEVRRRSTKCRRHRLRPLLGLKGRFVWLRPFWGVTPCTSAFPGHTTHLHRS